MNKQWFNVILSVMLVAVLGITIHACSGGGGGSSGGGSDPGTSVQLSGSVASGGGGYTVAMSRRQVFYAKALSMLGFASPAFAVAPPPPGPIVDKIVAIPMDRGSLASWNMQNSVTQDINNADGSFSLSLSTHHDWLLVLINSQATGTVKYVGSVAMDTSLADSLLNLPATDAAILSLPLGTLSLSGSNDDAISSGTVTAADFSMTADQLTAMAKSDDLFRNAMNIVNNYGNAYLGNGPTDWYMMRPDFFWLDSGATLTTGYSNPLNMAYQGMNFQIDTNTTNVTMTSICGTAGVVKLYPPSVVSLSGTLYDHTTPIANSGLNCATLNGTAKETLSSSLYATNAYGGKISYSVLGSIITNPVPPGYWEWRENDVPKAAFEVGNVNPPVTATGKPMGFVPSFLLHVDGTNKILSVDIKWWYWNGSSYVEVIDKSVLKHFINSAEVKFDVGMGTPDRKTCEMYVDPTTTTNVAPSSFAGTGNCSSDWYYGSTDPAKAGTNTGVKGFYETGGFGYFFDFPIKP
jgi:hypothetical protein